MPAATSSWATSPPTPPSSGPTSSSAPTDQLNRFLDANAERIAALGGLTLIDEDPDYLAIAPDLTFRSRTRFLDDATGEWVSETEVIETAAELIELYNPADVYAAFAEAAREAAGLGRSRPAPRTCSSTAQSSPTDAVGPRRLRRGRRRVGRRQQPAGADDDEIAAQRLYDLALTFQERSQRAEAGLLEQFERRAARSASSVT